MKNCTLLKRAFESALAQNEARRSLSKGLIVIGVAASKYSSIKSQTFDVKFTSLWLLDLIFD